MRAGAGANQWGRERASIQVLETVSSDTMGEEGDKRQRELQSHNRKCWMRPLEIIQSNPLLKQERVA